MDQKKYESTFIPCGDALEKMELFADAAPEKGTEGKGIYKVEEDIQKDSN